LPGLAFSIATSSFTEFAGELGGTMSTLGRLPSIATAEKSFSVS
jgi:hypothetical protein